MPFPLPPVPVLLSRQVPPASPADGRHAFDFFEGRWLVHNRRLTKILVGSTTWRSFDAYQECRLLLGGMANVDEMRTVEGEPVGVSLRAFDHAIGTWSIWWVTRGGVLEPPVEGTFRGGVGTFTGKDTYEGRPIEVKFTWSKITHTSAQWEQAFSEDGGRTWETNWVMTFERLDAQAPRP